MTENTGYIIVVIPYTIYHFYTGTISQTTVYISGLQCLQGGAYLYYEEKSALKWIWRFKAIDVSDGGGGGVESLIWKIEKHLYEYFLLNNVF